jgi:hypothetical protein
MPAAKKLFHATSVCGMSCMESNKLSACPLRMFVMTSASTHPIQSDILKHFSDVMNTWNFMIFLRELELYELL